MALLQALVSALTLAQPEVLRRVTNAIAGRDMTGLQGAIIFGAVTAALFCALVFFKDVYGKMTQNFYEREFAQKMIKRLIDTRMIKLDHMRFGDVSTAIIRNVEAYADAGLRAVQDGSAGAFSLTLVFIYMWLAQWRLAICVLIYNLVIRFFAVFVERKIKENSMEVIEAMKESGNELTALLRNMLTVRVYSNGEFFVNRLKAREESVRKSNWKSFVWVNGFQDFIWAFSKLAEFLIVYGVGAWLISTGEADLSILLTFVFANDLFTIGINSVSYYIEDKAQAEAYRSSLEEILNEPDCENEAGELVCDGLFSVSFKNVSFSYGENKVLDDVSFTIRPGEKVLIKGPNGHGKSTVLKLVSGLYRPQSGEILFGGEPVRRVNINSLLKNYEYISQNCNLLDGDVFENLTMSHDYDVQKSIKTLAALKMERCEKTAPANLSMGEKRRLNIGRSLYKGFRALLLCDEILSNIDRDNRDIVVDALERVYEGATVIMVSHDDIAYKFDRVLRVENGKVREERA